MNMGPRSDRHDERILILAPSRRDAPTVASVLERAGVSTETYPNLAELCQALDDGAGAALVAEEAVALPEGTNMLRACLERQPPWSEPPIVLVTTGGSRRAAGFGQGNEHFSGLGNLMLLERPLRSATLVSAMHSALRARRRQYQVRDHLRERERAEERLRHLNETLELRVTEALAERKLLADIVDGTDAFVQVADLGFRWLAINKAAATEFQHIFGVGRPKAGDSMLELLAGQPENQAAVTAVWSRALRGEEFVEVHELGDPSLGRRHYEMRFRTLRDRDGRMIGAYQFVYDVTDRLREQARLREAEAALGQAQKMEAVGQLTGGIAHDFNNLLQGVAGSLDLIRRKSDDSHRVRRWAEAGLQAAQRGAKLTSQLLAFSRAQRIEAKPLIVEDLVAGMHELLERTLGQVVKVTLDLDQTGAPVLTDATQLEMAVLNLTINARDAMPENGELTIATRLRRVTRDPELEPGEYVELRVSDTGSGMPPEVAARAFDPFFTTKDVGKGTGLGLSQVYSIARQAGGTARIESRPGEGTTVRLLLRRTAQGVIAEPVSGESARYDDKSSATVLVVDDDADVRSFLVDSLEALGYRVEPAEDGHAGLAAFDRIEPDLMVVDFAMPGMNGAEVARAARERRPDLPIIFASGYSDTAAIEGVAGSGTVVLRKPFRIDELHAAVAEALGAA